jgi:hypothetical protein
VQRKSCYDVQAPKADAKRFDKWFYSLSKKEQDKLRDSGVLPYREMWQPKHVFEVKENHKAWGTTDNIERVEKDEFISREHVLNSLRAFMHALTQTDSFVIRRHIELIKWALEMPTRLSSRQLGKMFGLSHEAIQKRARFIRSQLNVSELVTLDEVKEFKTKKTLKRNLKQKPLKQKTKSKQPPR